MANFTEKYKARNTKTLEPPKIPSGVLTDSTDTGLPWCSG